MFKLCTIFLHTNERCSDNKGLHCFFFVTTVYDILFIVFLYFVFSFCLKKNVRSKKNTIVKKTLDINLFLCQYLYN